MKIISWNCCGKLREKYSYLLGCNADIYVVQECENPKKYGTLFSGFYTNYLWIGENDNKGLGVFAKTSVRLQKNEWPSYCLRHFLPVRVNDCFDLLGVWACAPYIEEYYIYQAINIKEYNQDTVIMGDFNSNVKWDKQHGGRNHSAVVKQLRSLGLISAYHYVSGEQEGTESKSTFYLYRHQDKKYHIDYCFLNPNHLIEYNILESFDWLRLSDHMPIQVLLKN